MRERSLLCFFARASRIAGFEILTGLSDKDAIAKAHLLFSERRDYCDAFGMAPASSSAILTLLLRPISRGRTRRMTDDQSTGRLRARQPHHVAVALA
jgi:hypothetical protein